MSCPNLESGVQTYLALRRNLGCALEREGALLLGFARYADRTGHEGPPHNREVSIAVFDRQLFFGRETRVVRALSLLDSHRVQLTGERRIGKTSFLHHLQRILAAENGGSERRSFPVFVDLEAVTARDLLHVLMEEAVEALAVAPHTLAALRFNRGQSEYVAADFAHDLRRVIEELSGRTPLPVRLVFLIDEIDAVREGPGANGDSWLGPLLLNGSPEFRVVLASVGRAMRKRW